MKYVVVLCDGMADEPLEELGGMTPLEKAHTPNHSKNILTSEETMEMHGGNKKKSSSLSMDRS